MTMFLKDAGLWDVVTNPPPQPNREGLRDPEWIRLNNKAFMEIFKCCEMSQQDLIEEEPSVHAA